MNFWNADTYQIVKAMKATGNASGLIERWKDMVAAWATLHGGPEAEAVKAWLPAWQVRPLYTAAELAPIFPMLAVALGLCKRPRPVKSAARLEHELIYAGLPFREIDGRKFFIVEQIHVWRDAPLRAILEIIYAQR